MRTLYLTAAGLREDDGIVTLADVNATRAANGMPKLRACSEFPLRFRNDRQQCTIGVDLSDGFDAWCFFDDGHIDYAGSLRWRYVQAMHDAQIGDKIRIGRWKVVRVP